eukprot:m51a1_g14464 hypothetical protein (308) ;mRNA; r:664299-665549
MASDSAVQSSASAAPAAAAAPSRGAPELPLDVLLADKKRAPVPFWYPSTWVAVDFAEQLASEHPYGIKKEFTESYAIYLRVRDVLRQLGRPAEGEEGEGVDLFDVCSGKGYTAVFLSGAYPRARVHMLDRDKKMNLAHLRAFPRVDMTHGNVLKEGFLSRWVDERIAPGSVGVLCGMHLCGLLSEQMARTFNEVPRARGLVLCPCCLVSGKVSDVAPRAYRMRDVVDNYSYWTLHLLFMLALPGTRRDVRVDDTMDTERNKLIVAVKAPRDPRVCPPPSPSSSPVPVACEDSATAPADGHPQQQQQQ